MDIIRNSHVVAFFRFLRNWAVCVDRLAEPCGYHWATRYCHADNSSDMTFINEVLRREREHRKFTEQHIQSLEEQLFHAPDCAETTALESKRAELVASLIL